jgi:superfamily I DNA/RNA helicase
MEAASRAAKTLGCGPDEFSWCRTIHSTAFRLLGLRPGEIFSAKDLAEFAETYGYDFRAARFQSEDGEPSGQQISTSDDRLFASLEWARARMMQPAEGTKSPYLITQAGQYPLFLSRYRDFKVQKSRLDFYDLLEECLALHLRPPVTKAIIDEAQDLSPIQIELVQRWFGGCERVYVAGDDDQAIYGFSGADSRWIIALAKRFPTHVLTQSYRVPRLAYEVAQAVISANKQRVPKEYFPRGAEGGLTVLRSEELADMLDGAESTFILGRHWKGVRLFAKTLRDRGIAFTVEKHPTLSPLGATASLRAYRSARALQLGHQISGAACMAMFKQIPSGKHGGNLLPRGAKKRAKENDRGHVTSQTLRRWGLDRLVEELGRMGVDVLTKIPRAQIESFRALEKRYGKIPTRPHVTAMSMHASKGREADTVIVLPEMSRAAYRGYMLGCTEEREAENRVAYVAVTRTRKKLLVALPETSRAYPYDAYATKALQKPCEERGEDDWWYG